MYQRYLGWFDANPAHLHPLPPVDAAVRYVEFMGGIDALVEKVQGSIAAGDYRWAAQVLDHAVFAEPERADVKLLQAYVLEQLGYRAESGPWRDFYLTGAQELRHGAPHLGGSLASSRTAMRSTSISVVMNLTITDRDDVGVVGIEHGAVRFTPGRHDPTASVTLAVTHLGLARLASGQTSLDELGDEATVTGDRAALATLIGSLDHFDASFAIVTP